MTMLARALARAVSKLDGLRILELPDQLDDDFVKEVVVEANRARPETKEADYALVLRERLGPGLSGITVEDSRGLAGYRTGDRLVVCRAVDYRAQATFATALAPALPRGFPEGAESEAALGAVISEAMALLRGDAELPDDDECAEALRAAVKFIRDAYEAEAEMGVEWRARWWRHCDRVLDILAAGVPDDPRNVWSAFGLPCPVEYTGYAKRHGAAAFVKLVAEAWSQPDDLRRQFERASEPGPTRAAYKYIEGLRHAFALKLIGDASLVAAISLPTDADVANPQARLQAWENVTETKFFEPPDVVADRIDITVGGRALPGAGLWDDVLILPATDTAGGATARSWRDVTIRSSDLGCGARAIVGDPADNNIVRLEPSRDGDSQWEGQYELAGLAKKAVGTRLVIEADEPSRPQQENPIFLPPVDAPLVLLRPAGTGAGRRPKPKVLAVGADDAPGEHVVTAPGQFEILVVDQEDANWVLTTPDGDRVEGTRDTGFSAYAFQVRLRGGEALWREGQEAVRFLEDDRSDRPANPLVAAARKVMPDPDVPANLPLLGKLERFLTARLMELTQEDQHLGQVVVRLEGETLHSSPQLVLTGGLFFQPSLFSGRTQLVEWSPPSQWLLGSPAAQRLRRAYSRLDLARACSDSGAVPGTPVSFLPLRGVRADVIEEILEAHNALIAAAEADEAASEADAFWARVPFSVTVLDQDRNRVRGLMLSPIHPLRLAWRWSVENALIALPEDLQVKVRLRMAELADGSQFPLVAPGLGRVRLVAVPVDAGEDQVFLGWSVLLRAQVGDTERLDIPARIAGEAAPLAASSGLNEPSVRAALRDFRRLRPEVSTLVVDLAAGSRVPRAQELDRAVVSVARELADAESTGLPGGLRIWDNKLRVGAPDREALIGQGRQREKVLKLEWRSYAPEADATGASYGHAHVRLLQDSPVALAACTLEPEGVRSGLPEVPLRRVVARDIASQLWRFSPRVECPWPPFKELLEKMETAPDGDAIGITVDRQFAAFDRRRPADWYVAGDSYLDPRSLQSAAQVEGEDLMLWEWRPGFATVSRGGTAKIGERPYVVICSLPSTIRRRVDALTKELGAGPDAVPASSVVQTLASRGIGLNTLLARDENHAIGAIGFYWALKLVGAWMDRADGFVRMCVPMDAVDGLVGLAGSGEGPAETNMRADLLLLEGRRSAVGEASPYTLTMVPLEIKAHLASGATQDAEAVEQALATRERLFAMAKSREDAALGPWVRAIVGTILEAGVTLAPEVVRDSAAISGLLIDQIAGRGSLQVARAIAVEFTPDVGLPLWDTERFGPDAGVLKLDPTRLWGEFGTPPTPGQASESFCQAIGWACAEGPAAEEVPKASDGIRGGAGAGGLAVPAAPPPVTTVEPVAPVPGTPSQGGPPVSPGSVVVPPIPPPPPAGPPSQPATPSQGTDGRTLPVADLRPARLEEIRGRHRLVMRVLSTFGARVDPPADGEAPFLEGPAVIRYLVRPSHGVTITKISRLAGQLALELGLAANESVVIRHNRGNVEIVVPKPESERTFYSAEQLWDRWAPPSPTSLAVPIGVAEDGKVVCVDLASSDTPNLLIGGQTGSGKSYALLTLLAGLSRFYSPARLGLVLIDPKRTEFWSFQKDPHLIEPLLFTAREAIKVLARAVQEMERRYTAMEGRYRGISEWELRGGDAPPHWVIVIDEYGDLTSDDGEKRQIEASLIRLGQKARAAGIHLVIATQRPDAQVISANLRANLPGKLGLHVRSHTESSIILGQVGAEDLSGKGDGLLCGGANIVRLQCARPPASVLG